MGVISLLPYYQRFSEGMLRKIFDTTITSVIGVLVIPLILVILGNSDYIPVIYIIYVYIIYIYIYKLYKIICYKVNSADISINVIYIYVELNLIQFSHYVISIYLHAYIFL